MGFSNPQLRHNIVVEYKNLQETHYYLIKNVTFKGFPPQFHIHCKGKDKGGKESSSERQPLIGNAKIEFEAKRRARKAARNARPWMSGEDAPGAGAKPKAKAKDDPATRAKRKEWGGNPLEWVDDDEGVKQRKRGRAESSEDEDDPYDDGIPPITGASVFDADETEVKTLLNTKDDGDDFWRDDVF